MTGPRTLGELLACPRSTATWHAVRRAWDRMRARQRRRERLDFGREEMAPGEGPAPGWVDVGGEGG